MIKLRIGIDPGKQTGFAVYSVAQKRLTTCCTMGIVEAMDSVRGLLNTNSAEIEVWFEDARQRKWIPKNKGREVLQGVGSVKRDCTIWQEFCEFHHIAFRMIPPGQLTTKLKDGPFRKVTGWDGRTSNHARDAAMIVFGS